MDGTAALIDDRAFPSRTRPATIVVRGTAWIVLPNTDMTDAPIVGEHPAILVGYAAEGYGAEARATLVDESAVVGQRPPYRGRTERSATKIGGRRAALVDESLLGAVNGPVVVHGPVVGKGDIIAALQNRQGSARIDGKCAVDGRPPASGAVCINDDEIAHWQRVGRRHAASPVARHVPVAGSRKGVSRLAECSVRPAGEQDGEKQEM